MAAFYLNVILLSALCHSNAMVLRNNALMTKMVSKFQHKDNAVSEEQQNSTEKPARVLTLMQHVLCRNFPSIPCHMITQDETLKELIQSSINQIKAKKATTERSVYDLKMDFEATNADFVGKSKSHKNHKPARKRNRTKEAKLKYSKLGIRKKLRKFYPHLIKYKDRMSKDKNRDSVERQSTSAEVPNLTRNHHKTFEADNLPVWHRDYTKHGEPSINMFIYDDDKDKQLKTKIIKNAAEGGDYDRFAKQRKNVLHPDVYIKKRFRNKPVVDSNQFNSATAE